jgi:cell division protein ZapB
MTSIRQNRLIPVFAVIILLCVAGVLYKALSGTKHGTVPVPLETVPKLESRPADADSPADTLRTLTAKVGETQEAMQRLHSDNEALRVQNQELLRDKASIEDSITRRLTEQFSRPDASGSPIFSGLNTKIDELAARVERYAPSVSHAGTSSDIPAGLGFDDEAIPAGSANTSARMRASSAQLVWIEPIGAKTVIGPDGQPQLVRTAFAPAAPGAQSSTPIANPAEVRGELSNTSAATADGVPLSQDTPSARDRPAGKPYFTIPENSTLIGSTAMTALVGRIPMNGKVTDAMPFKALIGRTNLAANGLEVPEDISGMVVSGIAVGDWTLSCTQGYVQSVTFLFVDGTIRTVSNRTKGALTGNTALTGGGVATTEKVGWISDERGVPCISGERITNAASYLSTTVSLKAMEAGAKAAALSQTTTVTNGFGGTTSALTGDPTQFILGNIAAGGVSEISDWIKQRLDNTFDAVYVKPGLPIAVHLDEEIQIDKAPDARRLDYGRSNGATATRFSPLD